MARLSASSALSTRAITTGRLWSRVEATLRSHDGDVARMRHDHLLQVLDCCLYGTELLRGESNSELGRGVQQTLNIGNLAPLAAHEEQLKRKFEHWTQQVRNEINLRGMTTGADDSKTSVQQGEQAGAEVADAPTRPASTSEAVTRPMAAEAGEHDGRQQNVRQSLHSLQKALLLQGSKLAAKRLQSGRTAQSGAADEQQAGADDVEAPEREQQQLAEEMSRTLAALKAGGQLMLDRLVEDNKVLDSTADAVQGNVESITSTREDLQGTYKSSVMSMFHWCAMLFWVAIMFAGTYAVIKFIPKPPPYRLYEATHEGMVAAAGASGRREQPASTPHVGNDDRHSQQHSTMSAGLQHQSSHGANQPQDSHSIHVKTHDQGASEGISSHEYHVGADGDQGWVDMRG